MPHRSRQDSIDVVVRDIITPIVARVVQSIAGMVESTVTAQIEAQARKRAGTGQGRKAPPSRVARREITRWAADRRARRVPNFAIEATGLDTKKKIVAKYGADAVFEKGKALPPVLERKLGNAKAQVKPKPPIVRKKGRAAA